MCRIFLGPLHIDVRNTANFVTAREESLLVYCNELAVNNIAILCDGIRSELVMLHVLEVLHRSISVRHVSPRHHPHEDRTVRPYGYDICYGLALDVIQSLPSHQGQWSHPFGIDLVVG